LELPEEPTALIPRRRINLVLDHGEAIRMIPET
jgi:hypothetical protein